MWWPGPEQTPDFWREAHNSPGATESGTRWALADGETGVAPVNIVVERAMYSDATGVFWAAGTNVFAVKLR